MAPQITISSIKQSVPSMSCNMVFITRWKTSGPDVIPNGRRVNRYHPNGVMNVVRLEQSGDNGICQKPDAASKVVKYRAPCILANRSSATGNWNLCLCTHWFNSVKSTQIRIFLQHGYHRTDPLGGLHDFFDDSSCQHAV